MQVQKSGPKTTVNAFLNHLISSGLLGEEVVARYRKNGQNQRVVQQMIADGVLTAFQARQILAGRIRGFFIGDKYKIIDQLGRGGMGRVLLCEHLKLERFVAIKLMDRSFQQRPGAVERFMREARTAAKFDHPNLGRVFDVEVSSLGPYMVMEYIDGTNLQDFVAKHGPLGPEQAAGYLRQAAMGLQQAHLAKLVHRDIKPSNLMLDRSGMVKLLDLGLARIFDEKPDNQGLTQQFDQGAILGTADFIAPEQALESSRADIRADIYSLGCTGYFFLTRELPAGSGTSMQKLLRHQSQEPPPIASRRSGLPAELIAVIGQMMTKDPAKRYQTPLDVITALAPFAASNLPPPPADKMPDARGANFQFGLSPSVSSLAMLQERRSVNISQSGRLDSASWGESASETMSGKISSTSKALPSMSLASEIVLPSPDLDDLVKAAEVSRVAALPSPSCPAKPTMADMFDPSIVKVVGITTGAAVAMMLMALGIWVWSTSSPNPSGNAPPSTSVADASPPPAAAGVASPPSGVPSAIMRAGGSSFVKPIMDYWAGIYEQKFGRRVEYVSTGSSKGVQGVMAQFLDFGCSDAPLTDPQIAETGGKMLHVPLVMGAVVPTYNVINAEGEPLKIRFTGPVLADIFLGTVVRWNDPALAVNNPGVALPDLPITVVARKDGSGTTNIWTDYLSKASTAWKAKVGVGNAVKWPVGLQGDKNNGVADLVSRTAGGIGYVELSYALANRLAYGPVRNRQGAYVEASVKSITAAAADTSLPIPADFRYSLTDSSGANAFPIVGTCWALFSVDLDPEKRKEVIDFLTWATTDGQSHVGTLHYGALPPNLVTKVQQVLQKAR